MNDHGMMNAAYLFERGEQCRRLAQQALSAGIAAELWKLARDYDKDAARLESCPPFSAVAAE